MVWDKSKINKKCPKKGRMQDLSDSDIHLSYCKESDFSCSDADSDAKF